MSLTPVHELSDGQGPAHQIYLHTLRYFLSPLIAYMDSPKVSEIMINGPNDVFVEIGGKLRKVEEKFSDPDALHGFVKNLAQYVGKTLTPDVSRFDARLPDGSRVHVTLPPFSRNGICVAIRKFSDVNFKVADLVASGSLSDEAAAFLRICVLLEKNLLVSGGTGSGKTSLLNALSGLLPPTDRILVLEDSSELRLQQEHVLYFECVSGDRHGRGRVTIRDMFHSAMRMRPTRVVVGEVRSGEALDMIQAMTSGHSGSMSTIHANTPADALSRLETLALMGGLDLDLRAIRVQVASAIDVVVQISRFRDGSRRLVDISEVEGLSETGTYKLASIYKFELEEKQANEKVLGGLRWTGSCPTFSDELALHNLQNECGPCAHVFPGWGA